MIKIGQKKKAKYWGKYIIDKVAQMLKISLKYPIPLKAEFGWYNNRNLTRLSENSREPICS